MLICSQITVWSSCPPPPTRMHRVGTGGLDPHPPTKVCLSDGNLQQLAAQPDSSPNKGHICGQGTSKSLSEQMFGMWLSRLAFLPAPLWEFETTAPPPHLVPYELEDRKVRGPEKQPPQNCHSNQASQRPPPSFTVEIF